MKITLYLLLSFCMSHIYSQNAPFDSPYPKQNISIGKETIGNEYPYAQGWFQSATIKDLNSNNGYVVVDYYKLIEIDQNNNKKIIEFEDYKINTNLIKSSEGGLYSRNPATGDFCHTKLENMDNAFIKDGNLYILSGDHGDRVSHWWTNRYEGKPGCKYEIEVKFAVVGVVAFQVGCDYYSEPFGEGTNMIPEPWVSNWYTETNKDFRTDTVPLYNSDVKFQYGIDYGVTTNGIYFASKKLIDYCGGSEQLQLKSQYLSWKDTPMNLLDNYWLFDSGTKFKINQKIEFCFSLGPNSSNQYIPHLIVNDDSIDDMSNVRSNADKGYNFYLNPVEKDF